MTLHASLIGTPRIVFVPDATGFADWQAAAAEWHAGSQLVDMPRGDGPRRNPWLGRIDRAVAAAPGPAVIAAHGLGALAVAWWGGLLGARLRERVAGALLVAPARAEDDPHLAGFAPLPTAMLPFPAIVASGGGDVSHARACAAEWVSDVCEAAPDRVGTLLELLLEGGHGVSHYAYRPEPPIRPVRRPVRREPRPAGQRL